VEVALSVSFDLDRVFELLVVGECHGNHLSVLDTGVPEKRVSYLGLALFGDRGPLKVDLV